MAIETTYLQKKIIDIVDKISKCDDFVIDEQTITVANVDFKIDYDSNIFSIINQDSVTIDITARAQIYSEDNLIKFSNQNFKQKASGRVFRGKISITHKSGTFTPYELNFITIKPLRNE